MRITINVPLRADIIAGGFDIPIAGAGQAWSLTCLGDYAARSGVYVHHSRGKILYVGKTTAGQWGNFGERLRRECQHSSSQNSYLHQLLAAQPSVKAYLLDLDDLDMMVDPGPMQLPKERKALIMEQILIGLLQPEGNRV